MAAPRRRTGPVTAHLIVRTPAAALVAGDALLFAHVLTGLARTTMIDTDQVARAILIAATLIVADAALFALLLINRARTSTIDANQVVGALLIVATLIVGDTAISAPLLTGPAAATATGADQIARAVPVAAASVPGRPASPGWPLPPPIDAATPVPAGGACAAIEAPAREAPAAARAANRGLRLRLLRAGSTGEHPCDESAESGECGSAVMAAGEHSAETVESRGIHTLLCPWGPSSQEGGPRVLRFA